uniref:IQ motif containing E n=1 Tax=Lates calcarifer TaxID=8187 RepID=A0A4W6FFW4_LATCA
MSSNLYINQFMWSICETAQYLVKSVLFSSKLQSELRTTNLEELKITVETYFEEIQRLRMLLEAAEKSSRAESKCSQRQQRALSSTVHRLTENLKQLQQENTALREELNTDSPAGGIKGYRDWSKQRLLRRLLEVEKRPEDGRRHAQSAKSSGRLDQEVQATPAEILGFTMATEAVVSVGTITEEGEEVSDLRERFSQLEKERVELQETLSSKEEELEQLWSRIQTLEDDKLKPAQAELSSLSPTTAVDCEDSPSRSGVKEGEEGDAEGGEKEGERHEDLGEDAEEKRSMRRQHEEREKAARAIQTNWREHRNRDIVMLQSALRGHLLRESKLKDLLKDTQNKVVEATSRSDVASSEGGEMDVVALTMIQSAFRGHLARCSLSTESSGFSVPSLVGNSLPMLVPRTHSTTSRTDAASVHNEEKKQGDEDSWPVSSTHASRLTPTTDQTELHCTAESGGAAAIDSDDSDDIIVSPSRPLRSREVLIL